VSNIKLLLKDWTPPAVWRLARRLASSDVVRRIGRDTRGRERDASFYDQSFRGHAHWRKHYTESHYYPLWLVVADRMIGAGAVSVLDIGCGPGQMATLLRDKGIPRYLGVDISSERITWARSICQEFDFVEGDIFQSELLQTRDYDTVLCTEFLEHVERDLEVIEQIRSGTRFYASVPNFPAAGHVRHFLNTDSVGERYGEYFEVVRIDQIRQDSQGHNVWFLLEGIKR
jgi:SAM-dependent methyltransferase